MRYLESESTYILSNFTTSDTVTITVYKLSDNSKVIDAVACSEIGTTGRFKYSFSQSISTKTEYLWVAENGTEEQQGKIILGGWPDEIKDQTDYIPSNLGDVPTAAELVAAHGSGAWTTADVSALATTVALATHDTKLDEVKAKTDTIDWNNITDVHNEAFGKWVLDPLAKTLTLYKADGITTLKVFDLTSTEDAVPAFIARTPQ